MKYVSTRGAAPTLEFEDVLLAGLASDGGLYVPSAWPVLSGADIAGFAGRPYADVAEIVMRPFIGKAASPAEFSAIVSAAYESFRRKAVAPLVQLDAEDWLLELFHGPTLAFKDVAMQLLGRLFDHVLAKRGARITIVGATSGDTGGAAIEALRGRELVDIFILHPEGRVSDVQRRQMTTVLDDNVHNIAIDGSFDDCQNLVKAMFGDEAFRTRVALSAVNSINWARIMAQIVYYFTSAAALGGPARAFSYSVPTGNFGDIFAGYAAKRMGLPMGKLIIATNVNDILYRTLRTGRYEMEGVTPSNSPSMDIQISSNFERALYEAYGRNAVAASDAMTRLKQSGAFDVEGQALASLQRDYLAERASEEEIAETIADALQTSGELIDPHTACGVAAARKLRAASAVSGPIVTLATAHPAKFPAAVHGASGISPTLPSHLSDLLDREERASPLPNDLEAVEAFIVERSRAA